MAELLLAKSDGTMLLRLDLDGRRALCIGRSPRCDIVVPTPTVSRRHALLYRHPAGWRMVDLGSRNGLHVEGGGRRVVTLDEDRWIRLGAVHFWFAGEGTAVPDPSMIDAELLISPDTAEGPIVSVVDADDRPIQRAALSDSKESMLIGSDPCCDVVVDDPSVAPVHLVVYREGRRWCVAPGGDPTPMVPSDATARTANGHGDRDGDTLLIDGHRTRRRRVQASMVVRLGSHRVVFAGVIRPTEEARAPSVAAVMDQWRQAQLAGTDQAGTVLPAGHVRPETAARATNGGESESPDSVISAFLGESAEDDE